MNDAELGRTVKWFARWHGGSLLVCLILVLIFGERGRWSDWIVAVSLLAGIPFAIWLTRAEKKRDAALQSPKDVVE